MKCPVCAAVNPTRARFCGDCGAPLQSAAPAPAKAAHGSPVLPWFLAGCAALAIHAVIIIVALKGGINPAPAPDMSNNGSSSGSGAQFAAPSGRPTDLSQMTPREAADRLWTRIMTASESGDTAQVSFFGPMAYQAYNNVSPLDADARFHIGLIALALNDPDKARAQADTIARENPTHLFGSYLKAMAGAKSGRTADIRAGWQAFLTNYDSEMRKNLEEYQQHNAMLTDAHTNAQRIAGGR